MIDWIRNKQWKVGNVTVSLWPFVYLALAVAVLFVVDVIW